MKKASLILLIFVLIAATLIFGFIRSLGVSDPAALVPPNTIVFASIPDLLRTVTRWPGTSLAKISAEPEVKEFLKKPTSFLVSTQNGKDAGGQILGVKPRRVFLAFTKLSPGEAHALLGFQFLGGQKDVADSLEFVRGKISQGAVVSSRTSSNYRGDTVESVACGALTIHSAIHGRWGFLANNLPTLQEALDRAAGRNRSPSLAGDANYLKISSYLPNKPDFQIFINSKLALDALLTIGATMGNVPDPAQVRQLQNLVVLGISAKLDGANIRDTMAIAFHNPPNVMPLQQHATMQFTNSNTLGYLETSKEWYQAFGTAIQTPLKSLLSQAHLSMDDLHRALGSELAIFFSWPAESLRPHVIITSDVQNKAQAIKYLNQAGFTPFSSNSKLPSTSFYQLNLPQYPIVAPTIAFHHNLLFAGLVASDIEETLSQASTLKTLENSSAFASTLPNYQSQNLLFSFLDSKEIFERAYSTFRPIIIFGTALTSDLPQIIDTSKLPSAEAISKHLQPVVSTQRLQNNVMIFDSAGPVTLDQIILIFLLTKAGVGFSPQP